MQLVFRLVLVAVVGFSLAGDMTAGALPSGSPSSERVAAKLHSALVSAARHATLGAELQVPDETRTLRPLERTDARLDLAMARQGATSSVHPRDRELSDQRPAIRLTFRGARVAPSSDEPPERPRSLS